LPQDVVASGETQSFEVTIGEDYWVFIGMGTWEADFTGLVCPSSRRWWKRRYTTDVNWNDYWVWRSVSVTGHNGDWEWTIAGSYENGTLNIYPAGNPSLPFNVTSYDPIQ
jgi:hypothetical protein